MSYANQITNTNFYPYDAALRKTFETSADGQIIRYTNNAAGGLLTFTDGKGRTTTWNYDLYGRATSKWDQSGTMILAYQYDADNRLTNRWSAAMGNLLNIQYPTNHPV